jgi:predicted Zn-ribbon and HTH transcriptional regulator
MKPEHRERAAICNSCEHLNKTLSICKQCGCFMPAKTRLNWARCPIGKWEKIETKNEEGQKSL